MVLKISQNLLNTKKVTMFFTKKSYLISHNYPLIKVDNDYLLASTIYAQF